MMVWAKLQELKEILKVNMLLSPMVWENKAVLFLSWTEVLRNN